MSAPIPLRTCIGCGRKASKYDLLRIVRAHNSTVELDIKSKKPGRGAYLCYDQACFETALKRHAIQRHLSVIPPHSFLQELRQTLDVKNRTSS